MAFVPIRRQNGKCATEGYHYINMIITVELIGLSHSFAQFQMFSLVGIVEASQISCKKYPNSHAVKVLSINFALFLPMQSPETEQAMFIKRTLVYLAFCRSVSHKEIKLAHLIWKPNNYHVVNTVVDTAVFGNKCMAYTANKEICWLTGLWWFSWSMRDMLIHVTPTVRLCRLKYILALCERENKQRNTIPKALTEFW